MSFVVVHAIEYKHTEQTGENKTIENKSIQLQFNEPLQITRVIVDSEVEQMNIERAVEPRWKATKNRT